MIIQKRIFMPRLGEFSKNIIWVASVGAHLLYVWRVRIPLSMNPYPTDLCSSGMHKDGQRCTDLIKLTANSLSEDVVALMLVAVQKDNLEVSINHAIKRWVAMYNETRMAGCNMQFRSQDAFEEGMGSTEVVIKRCLAAFPWMWVSCNIVYGIGSF